MMKLPRRNFLHLANGRCRPSGRSTPREGATCEHHRRLLAGQRDRPRGASDWSVAGRGQARIMA
jgi:hypothetical protein